MANVRTFVAKKIREETGWNIGQFIANFLVKNYTRRWVSSATVRASIQEQYGYNIAQSQVAGTLARLGEGRYRTDGLLEKHKTQQGVWRWVPDRDLKSVEPLKEEYETDDFDTEELSATQPVKVEESKRVIPVNPDRPLEVKYGKTMDHDTDGIMIVTSIVGGYLIKIDGVLYVAKKLDVG